MLMAMQLLPSPTDQADDQWAIEEPRFLGEESTLHRGLRKMIETWSSSDLELSLKCGTILLCHETLPSMPLAKLWTVIISIQATILRRDHSYAKLGVFGQRDQN